ncbi:hypothetical protein OSB04_019421 [Centaurea solstitialis]|uniref:No apical meristem-associated C-terminal domain-containing protein n=1 Tax=Centaurea solstitialis TaxID=347529 RepID=A0AA38T9U5_9ASTR|nr:hypothetical protein OSB04_019421 [Centaurea solstitialis]
MKSRYARLNEAANKWVAAYREAYRQKRSGMSTKDVEKEAHAIFEMGGSKFNDLVVFNDVMCKHPKWDLQLEHNTTRSRPVYDVDDEESGGSTKRSRTSEEGDYSVETNKESPNSIPDYSEEFRALNITRKTEVEMMSKRMEFENDKAQHKTLHILLAKENLSPEEEVVHMSMSLYYCVVSFTQTYTPTKMSFNENSSPGSDEEYDE